MRPALHAIAARQHGIFTRAQALLTGYTEREIRALTRPDGPWAVVRLGVYCERARLNPLGQVANGLRAPARPQNRASALGELREHSLRSREHQDTLVGDLRPKRSNDWALLFRWRSPHRSGRPEQNRDSNRSPEPHSRYLHA